MTGFRLNIQLPADAWAKIQDALLLAWWDGFGQGLAWGLFAGVVMVCLVLILRRPR
jgi:hypothetical protein